MPEMHFLIFLVNPMFSDQFYFFTIMTSIIARNRFFCARATLFSLHKVSVIWVTLRLFLYRKAYIERGRYFIAACDSYSSFISSSLKSGFRLNGKRITAIWC